MKDAAGRILEQLLILRCQAGDDDAFAALIGRYRDRMTYYVRRLMGDGDHAEDVLQDTWLAAYRGLPRLRSPGAFGVWLYRIAHDKACHELRRRRDWVEFREDDLRADAPPDEPRFTAEQAGAIHRSLARLQAPHREVLILRFLEGMSYEHIAAVTSCPVGTVRSRLHHAKHALRRELENDHD
jgi:RNA polymerase sigma-70 factor (ECF subfamily)